MKRLIIVMAAIALSISAFAISKTNPSEAQERLTPQERKAKREAAQEAAIGEMKAAIAEQSFVFYPTSYTLPYQNPVMTYDRSDLYLNIYPEDLDINLPFKLLQSRASDFDASLVDYSDYTVKAAGKDGVNFIVTLQLNNVSNTNFSASFDDQDINLNIHLHVNVSNRVAFLTITPDFSPSITYQGTIALN